MITVKCEKNDCPNSNVEYNLLGTPSQVECGGCKDTLTGTNERPDPELLSNPEN